MAISSSSIFFRISFAILAALILLVVSQSAGSISAATRSVDGADGGCNDGVGTPYCTIGAAVAAAGDGDTINVFPGTYNENVDLNTAGGALTLITVDATGTPTPGTVTVTDEFDGGFDGCPPPGALVIDGFTVGGGALADAMNISSCDANDVTIKNVTSASPGGTGIGVSLSSGNIVVMNSTSNDTGGEGFALYTEDGDVTISDSTADGNADDGFDTHSPGTTSVSGSDADNNGGDGFDHDDDVGDQTGTLTITTSHASGNGTVEDADNFDLDFGGNVTISNSTGHGSLQEDGFDIRSFSDITITASSANGNSDEGIELQADGNVVLDRVTAKNNGDDGVEVQSIGSGEYSVDSVSVTDSVLGPNDDGALDLEDHYFEESGTYIVEGNVICQTNDGLESDADIAISAIANWWGDASGPTHPDNPSGIGDQVRDGAVAGHEGTADYDPWIDTITGSGDAATQGQPTVVAFGFTDTSVAFQQGPGDPNGEPTFAATTDNGTVSTSGFVKDGKLEVTLTPANTGTATVTVTGPCGLDGNLGGNAVVLDVAAAPVGPTATPAQLPETGGQSASGSGFPWLALIVGFAAMAAGASVFVMRARRDP